MSKVMAQAFANIDVTPDYTYGRGVVEAAALGIPTIASNTIEAARLIWPELCVGHEDDIAIERLLRDLLTNTSFTKRMSDQGIERCNFYSTKNSYERMREWLEAVDEKRNYKKGTIIDNHWS
jgi:glycosyltransferase involved in cell wall biosynthesis